MEHQHTGFEIPDDFEDLTGRPVDYGLLSQLVSACMDRCLPCQGVLTTTLVEDPVTAARLVEMACGSIHDTFGGLPSAVLDDDMPGPAALEFRRLARAGLDGANGELFAECARMDVPGRRAAVDTALDFVSAALAGPF